MVLIRRENIWENRKGGQRGEGEKECKAHQQQKKKTSQGITRPSKKGKNVLSGGGGGEKKMGKKGEGKRSGPGQRKIGNTLGWWQEDIQTKICMTQIRLVRKKFKKDKNDIWKNERQRFVRRGGGGREPKKLKKRALPGRGGNCNLPVWGS